MSSKLAVALCAAAFTTNLGMVAMAAPVAVTLARSAAIRLHTERTVVTLVPAPDGGGHQGGHIFLTARGLTASVTPGVVYGVYLDLAPGAAPGDNDPHYVGTVGFYDARPEPSERFDSFDVTAALSRLPGASDGSHTITFVPRGRPVAGADPGIAELALVRQ